MDKMRMILAQDVQYFHRDDGAEVVPGIWIGSLSTALRAEQSGTAIQYIVNLSGTRYESNVPVLIVEMNDELITEKTIDDFATKFITTTDQIREQRAAGKTVLIHCAAGVNRSACMIGVYLIRAGWSYDGIIKKLTEANQRRGVPLLTNQSFRQLLKNEASIRGK